MGGDSRPSYRGLESKHWIWMYIFHLYCCKNCNVCLTRPKTTNTRGRGWPIKKISSRFYFEKVLKVVEACYWNLI